MAALCINNRGQTMVLNWQLLAERSYSYQISELSDVDLSYKNFVLAPFLMPDSHFAKYSLPNCSEKYVVS